MDEYIERIISQLERIATTLEVIAEGNSGGVTNTNYEARENKEEEVKVAEFSIFN